MASAHGHSNVATLQTRRREPTSTATLRDRYEADLAKRFQSVKGLIRETVDRNDALRLSATLARSRRDFGFDSDAGKQAAFQTWLEGVLDDEVLEPVDRGNVLRGDHYTAQYVRASSRKGAEWAADRLREEGFDVAEEQIARSFEAGVHREKLEELYLRNYAALDGITDAVDTQISRTLSEGMGAGRDPRRMAADLNDRVEKIGIRRARTLARTETMHAHHVHTETRYAEAGVEEVNVITFDPCELCQALEADNPHPREEITELLPRHPNCVCSVTPVL